jgi:hypothetical protein
MLRKTVMAAAAAALALGGVAAFASPASAKTVVLGNAQAAGNITCNITGKVKITPALSDINTLPSTTVAKTKSSSCTGTLVGGYAVTSAKSTVTSVGTTAGTCTGLLTPGTSPFTAAVSWKASGAKLNASSATFTNNAPGGLGFELPGDPDGAGPITSASLAHTTVITGSFAGQGAYANVGVDTGPVLLALTDTGPNATGKGCGASAKNGKAKGIKKLTLTGGTFNIVP